MSMSISNEIKEDKLSFNKNSILTIAGETINTGETYEVGTDIINKKCDYLKVVGNISVSDESLTTDDFHPVVVLFEIKYEDEDGNHSLIYEHFYPKYQHEVGNKDTYTIIELKNKKLVDINVDVINNEDYVDSISIDKLQIFYSLIIDEETVQEMINKGGSGDVPVIKDLKIYNIDNNYTIDGYNKSLILNVVIPEEYLIAYKNSSNYVDVTWEIESLTGADYYSRSENTSTVVNNINYTLRGGKILISPDIYYSGAYNQRDGILKVRARLEANDTIFGDAVIEIKNSEVKDFYIKSISSEDGKLHTSEDVTIELGFLPEKSSCAISGEFVLQSYDGKGAANNVYGSNNYSSTNAGLGNNFTLRGVSAGKVSLYLGNNNVHKQFIFDVVDDADKTIDITTNTGLFEITQGGGQLEVYPRPNYDWHGGFSFSQVSIDGGSVTITDKGDYALITGDKNGKLNLICTPTYGPSAQCEITVSNQYPEDVKLTCADNIFKIPINGSLMIYAEAGNNPNSNYDKYTWAAEKLDADVEYSNGVWDKYCKYIGTALGKFRLSAIRNVDSKFMTSQVIKVVQSLDSDKTVLNYPNTHAYWVVYRRTDQSNRLWLLTIDGTATLDKLIKTTGNRLNTDNITLGAYAQWKIESGQWANHGSWSGDTSPAGSVGQLYASNLDIYDEEGNLLVAKTDNYDDVDFDAIIYGQDIYINNTDNEEV